jgi:uncharacterized protein YjbJ (UPF0337 family)
MIPRSIKSSCEMSKDKFKHMHSSVTDDDLTCVGGKKEEMLEKLQKKLGVTRKELCQIIIRQ